MKKGVSYVNDRKLGAGYYLSLLKKEADEYPVLSHGMQQRSLGDKDSTFGQIGRQISL